MANLVWDLLTLALLTLPEVSGLPALVPADAFASLQRVALALELAYPRESWMPHAYAQEVRTVRDRWRELHDAPPAADAQRWPDALTAATGCLHNRAYALHLAAESGS